MDFAEIMFVGFGVVLIAGMAGTLIAGMVTSSFEARQIRPQHRRIDPAELLVDRARAEAQLRTLQNEIARLKELLNAASTEIERLRAATYQAAREAAEPGDDLRFREAKRAFAKLYHPNNAPRHSDRPLSRADVFKEFWGEFERIEKGA